MRDLLRCNTNSLRYQQLIVPLRRPGEACVRYAMTQIQATRLTRAGPTH
jgi:hypothetical protein